MTTSLTKSPAESVDELPGLVRQIWDGQIDRRAFMRRALALGVAPAVAATVFTTYRARPAAARARRAGRGATPTPGGTLRFGRGEDSVTFDPIATFYNADIWLLQNVYEQLLRVAPNGTELEALARYRLGTLRRRADLYVPPAAGRHLPRRIAAQGQRRQVLHGTREK